MKSIIILMLIYAGGCLIGEGILTLIDKIYKKHKGKKKGD